VAVGETTVLPNQPATGATHRTPLGGDGYRAPMAAYIVDNMAVTGDAGGGGALLQVQMDERFCSLVAYLTVSLTQATDADIDVRYRLDTSQASSPVATQVQGRRLEFTVAQVSSATINDVWAPIPVIIPGGGAGGLFSAEFKNVDTDIYRLSALVYLFNINVRQVMPMGPLLWARGST